MGLIAFVFLRSPSDLLIWSLSISFLVLLIDWSYRAVAGPLSAIPNIHWLVPWTAYYNLYLKYFYNIRVSHYEAHLCDGNQFETRPIVRVGPNEVSVMSTAAIKKVFGGGFERSPWYSVFTNFGLVLLILLMITANCPAKKIQHVLVFFESSTFQTEADICISLFEIIRHSRPSSWHYQVLCNEINELRRTTRVQYDGSA